MKALEKILILCGILFWLMILVGIGNALFSQINLGSIRGTEYQINKEKWWGFGLVVAAGFVDGMVEGYEFDGRTSFERKWGVSPDNPFWGSNSWDTGKNTGWERQFGVVDFYHVADDLRKVGYISGGVTIGIGAAKRKQKLRHYLYDIGLSFVIGGISKWAGMYYIRHIDAF
jgi:hypothetical protein